MKSKTKIRLAVIPAAVVTAALIIAVAVLGVKLTTKKQTHSTFPAPLIDKMQGFPFIINPDDHHPQPAYKAIHGGWYALGTIEGVNPANINAIIKQVWGLTINDFKWVKDRWWEHNGFHHDTAYELTLDTWKPFTTFYERFR